MPRKERTAPERGPFQAVRANGVEGRAAVSGGQAPVLIAVLRESDGEVRLTLGVFRGEPALEIRRFEPVTAAKVLMPTRYGLAVAMHHLPELAEALPIAEAKAREMGLLGRAP
jgi:hypothetical protein